MISATKAMFNLQNFQILMPEFALCESFQIFLLRNKHKLWITG
jgi:hypothetical protein